jgi:hypothetical protein
MYVKQLFELIKPIQRQFIIITHNCDINVDESFRVPDNVSHWYSQNVNVENPKIESIPIGLENNRWFVEIDKKGKMMRKLAQKRVYKNMVYINHDIKTNPAKRTKPYEVLKSEKWATVGTGINGQGFDNYLDNIFNHPFVICPEGNGIDTHRIWECLYMRTIPIVLNCINIRFYKDLPILIIEDWEQITEKFLHDSFMQMAEKIWDIRKLTFGYWRDKCLT